MLQKGGGGGGGDEMVRTNYCSAPLPQKQPLAPKDHDVRTYDIRFITTYLLKVTSVN